MTGPYKVCSNDDPGLTLTYFTARSTLLPNAFVWENAEILDFMENIEVCELKGSTRIYTSSTSQGHCLTFVQDHSDLYFQTSAPKPLGPLKQNLM